MRKYLSSISQLFVLLLFLASCRQQQTEDKLELPSPEEYRSWNMSIDAMLNYPIPGHRDNFRVIYINQIGESVGISDRDGRIHHEYPEGTMIVKEIYKGLDPPEDGEEPIELTIMLKDSRHPKAQEGWLWIVKGFEPEKVNIFERNFCVDCHANANEEHPYGDRNSGNEFRDFVYFPPPSETSTD
ncbi:MAG: cytochrome P460 family protein [bacterium]|nr:cytochrome P460 family protein [bacterium]